MQLFPPPEDKKYIPAQMMLSKVIEPVISIRGYKPSLCGISTAEASFHLYERYWDILKTSRGNIPMVIDAFYRNDNKKIEDVLQRMFQECAKVIADFLYTAVSLAKGKFESDDSKKLEEIPLEKLIPIYRPWFTPMPEAYSHNCLIENFNLNENFKPVPLTLLMEKESKRKPVTFKRGIGTGGGFNFRKDSGFNYRIGYDIPADVFNQFRVTAGLNCLLENEDRVKLQVHWNKKIAYDTGIITGKEPVKEAIIDVSQGGILELVFKRIGAGYPGVHVVWGNPLLCKNKKGN
jgi:ABC-type cobalt transport system substrate-binding protein